MTLTNIAVTDCDGRALHAYVQTGARSVRKTPSLHQRKNAFPDAPSDQCNGLAHLDLDGFRFRLHGFREMHLEHAILEVGGHLAPIRILRKREAALEASVGAFDPVIFSPRFFLITLPSLPLSGDGHRTLALWVRTSPLL